MDGNEVEVPSGFRLVADEKRAAILYALAQRLKEAPDGPALRFSELRRRAGVRDSGNFNYHLDKLLDHFVQEEPDGEGYVLTYPGMAVVAALVGGEYEETDSLGPEPYGENCPVCGNELSVAYEGGILQLRCAGTPSHAMEYNLPAHAVEESDLAEAATLMTERVYADSSLVFGGRCPLCFGEMVVSTVDDSDGELVPGFDAACARCGVHYRLGVGQATIHHPAVVSFYADHGITLRSAPVALLGLGNPDAVERVGSDPDRFEVRVECDGDRLATTVDEGAQVVGVTRTDR